MTEIYFVRKQGDPVEVQTQEGTTKRCSIELVQFGKKAHRKKDEKKSLKTSCKIR